MPAVIYGRAKKGRPRRSEGSVWNDYRKDHVLHPDIAALIRVAESRRLTMSQVAALAKRHPNALARSMFREKPRTSTIRAVGKALGLTGLQMRALFGRLTALDIKATSQEVLNSATLYNAPIDPGYTPVALNEAVSAYVRAEVGLDEGEPLVAFDAALAAHGFASLLEGARQFRRDMAPRVSECLEMLRQEIPLRLGFLEEARALEVLRRYVDPVSPLVKEPDTLAHDKPTEPAPPPPGSELPKYKRARRK